MQFASIKVSREAMGSVVAAGAHAALVLDALRRTLAALAWRQRPSRGRRRYTRRIKADSRRRGAVEVQA